MKKYYYLDDNHRCGPFTKEELKDHEVFRTTLMWYEGCKNWVVAESIPELFEIVKESPPNIPNSIQRAKIRFDENWKKRKIRKFNEAFAKELERNIEVERQRREAEEESKNNTVDMLVETYSRSKSDSAEIREKLRQLLSVDEIFTKAKDVYYSKGVWAYTQYIDTVFNSFSSK